MAVMTPFLFSSFPVIACAAERAARSIAAMALLAETTVLLPCDGAHDLPSPVITTTAREGRRRSGDVIDVGASSFSSSSSSTTASATSPFPLSPPYTSVQSLAERCTSASGTRRCGVVRGSTLFDNVRAVAVLTVAEALR